MGASCGAWGLSCGPYEPTEEIFPIRCRLWRQPCCWFYFLMQTLAISVYSSCSLIWRGPQSTALRVQLDAIFTFPSCWRQGGGDSPNFPMLASVCYVKRAVCLRCSQQLFICYNDGFGEGPCWDKRLAFWLCESISGAYELMGLDPPGNVGVAASTALICFLFCVTRAHGHHIVLVECKLLALLSEPLERVRGQSL